LLERVYAMYAALDEAIAPILPAQMCVPGVNGAWSVTDTLAHLTFWHRNLLARLDGIATSQPPSDTAIDDDTWNRRCFDANRRRAPDDVLAELWRIQQAILDAMDALPEAIFFAAGEHGAPLVDATDGSILGHYPEHIPQIERWRDQHVTPPTMKSDLLYRIADGYVAWATTIDAAPPREMTLPHLHGGWSIKDEVAHVTFWEARVLAILHAALAGDEPPYRSSVSEHVVEAMNADVFVASQQRGLDDVLADMDRTHAAFVRAVEELPDDAIFDAKRFPWAGGEPLLLAIVGDTYEHYPEHTRNIQRWRAVRSMRGGTR
ncbi:MAG: ClbS/DfsB family four-helix bundle protein, partial [Chloroflexota bacterium]|nr:ClbS/DfsB family four-helix bundle protein [Chloroflexota bacterium]